MAKLQPRVATIVTQRKEAPARIAAIHRADVMRAQFAARIDFELAPQAKRVEGLPEIARRGKRHVTAAHKGALATRDTPGAGHHTHITLTLRQFRRAFREMTPVHRIVGRQINRRRTPAHRHRKNATGITNSLRRPRPMIRPRRGKEHLLPRLAIVLRHDDPRPMPHRDKRPHLRLRFEVTAKRDVQTQFHIRR